MENTPENLEKVNSSSPSILKKKSNLKKQLTFIPEERDSLESEAESLEKITKDNIFAKIFTLYFTSSFSLLFMGLLESVNYIFMGESSMNPNFNINSLGLGNIYLNIISVLFIFGVLDRFNVTGNLAFSSYGFENFGIYTIRTRIILAGLVILILIPSAMLSSLVLIHLNIPSDLALSTSNYIFRMIPAIFFAFNFYLNMQYLQIIKIYFIPCLITISGLIIHIIFCYFFIFIFQLDLDGICIASFITMLFCFLITTGYIKIANPNPKSLFFIPPAKTFNKSQFYDYTKLCFISGWEYFGQYIGIEIICFMCCYLDETSFSASLISLNFLKILKNLYMGFSLPLTQIIKEFLQTKQTDMYKYCLQIFIWIYIFIASILGTCTFFFSKNIGFFYTINSQTALLVSYIIFLWTFAIVFDNFNALCQGLLKGFGNDINVMKLNILINFTIMIPLSLVLCFILNYNVSGIWIGYILSVCFLTFINIFNIINLNTRDISDGITPNVDDYENHKISINYHKLGDDDNEYEKENI